MPASTKRAPRKVKAETYSEREARDPFERAVDVAVATKPIRKTAEKSVVS